MQQRYHLNVERSLLSMPPLLPQIAARAMGKPGGEDERKEQIIKEGGGERESYFLG